MLKSNRRISRKERETLVGFVEADPPIVPANLLILEAVKTDYKGWKFWRYDRMSRQWIEWFGLNDA